ncbi:MAG: Cys-tRNA(Pro) deacylase [Actinomycetaceae bacterium]|nr:Cys-tRNA(Pro) deacylase [Actinomycetaceae bacterium]MDY5854124.1 Cys-tRNA(Pro) deacylase [Arcanobacterium sp.]
MGKKKRDAAGARGAVAATGATAAVQMLNAAHIAYELIEYQHSDVMTHGFALDTVAVLGLDPNTVFKTLMVEADGTPAVGIVPASHHLNLKSLAKALGAKHATMMEPTKAERLTGYIRGGISPIGQRKLYPTVIDAAAQLLPTMVISGGKRSLSVALAPADLAALIHAHFAPIATLERRH